MKRFRNHTKICAAALLAVALAAPPTLATTGYATQDPAAEGRSDRYREGQRAISEQRWDDAVRAYSALADSGGAEADAALYWSAYADSRRNHKGDALKSLRKLLSSYPGSPWADDAAALELELRGGRDSAPALAGGDEELRLYALDALMQVEPERALPVLEKILTGDDSEKVKSRALFVLAQSDSPRAREILTRVIRTGQPVGLRADAVRMLGISGEDEDLAILAELGRDRSLPAEVQSALLDAYLIADASGPLAQLARTSSDPAVRSEAIQRLGAMDAVDELRKLWGSEKDPVAKRRLLEAFGIAGDVQTLARVAREDGTPEIRRQAIQGIAIADADETGSLLRDLYRELRDPADRRAVVEALMIQDDAKTLIELFRTETDPELKRAIVQQLALIDDPAATGLLLDIVEKKP